MFKILKKADFILLFVLILAGIASIVVPLAASDSENSADSGKTVIITVDGVEYGRYPLDEDKVIDVKQDGADNIVEIKDNTVVMASSTCKNQVCVNSGRIASSRQQIICLPNRVVVTIENNSSNNDAIGEIDAISN